MNINIPDAAIEAVVKTHLNNVVQKEISNTISALNIKSKVNERLDSTLGKQCKRIIADGRFYDAIAKRLAKELATEFISQIDINKVMEYTSVELAKKITITR